MRLLGRPLHGGGCSRVFSLAVVAVALVVPSAASNASPSAAHPTGVVVAKTGLGTVSSRPEGISCGSTCRAGFPEDEVVTLTATPEPGQSFTGWNGCAPTDSPTCTLVITDLECVIAHFTGGGSTSTGMCSPFPVPTSPPPAGGDHPPPGSRCTVNGTRSRDVIHGTAGNDVICGKGGDDMIYSGPGHDLLLGGSGNDKLFGRSGRDYGVGGPGDDTLEGGTGADELFGGRGADVLRARDGVFDVVNGGRGRDRGHLDGVDHVISVETRV